MPNPWEKYQQPKSDTASGPWAKYQAVVPAAVAPSVQPEATPQRSMGQEAMRQLGLTGRYLAEGAMSVPAMIADPLANVVNYATGQNVPLPSQKFSDTLTQLGLPKPEGNLEELVGAGTKALAGAGAMAGAGQMMTAAPTAAKSVMAGIAQQLAAAPVTQGASALGSAASGELARQAGAGPLGQLAANIAGGLAGGSIGGRISGEMPKTPQRLTADEIRQKSSETYQRAEQLGGVLKPETTDRFLDDIATIRPKDEVARQLGARDFIAENSDVFESMRGQPMTLDRATAIDQRLTELLDNETLLGKPTQNGRQILLAQQKLRDIIDNAMPDDVIGSTQGFYALKDARRLWSQQSKMRTVEAIIQRAQGMEQPATGIRTGFRTLLNNPNRLRGFSPQEVDAIKKASQTGITGNLFRAFGSGLVPIGAGVAGAAGGPIGAMASGIAGYGIQQGSKAIGQAMQNARAENVAKLISDSVRQNNSGLVPTDPVRLSQLLGIAIGANQ